MENGYMVNLDSVKLGGNIMNIWIDGTYGSGKSFYSKKINQMIEESVLYQLDDYINGEWKNSFSSEIEYADKILRGGWGHSNKFMLNDYKMVLEGKLSLTAINIIDICLLNELGKKLVYEPLYTSDDKHIIIFVSEEIMMQRIKKQPNRDIQLAESFYHTCTAFIENYSDALIIDNNNDNDFEKNITKCMDYIFNGL